MEPHRYFRFSDYLRQQFGCRVHRVPIDAGFTCPNRDGTVGTGGCLYCDHRGSAAAIADRNLPIHEQMRRGMEWARLRYGAEKFIAYFQAFTNTHAPPERLKQLYTEATSFPGVVGLSIGTRPDCVPEPVLDVTAEFAGRLDTWVELGLQSAHDTTLQSLSRGHSVADFAGAALRIRMRGIKLCAHLIIGLPGETREMILHTARFIRAFPPDGVKIHLFHVLAQSPIARLYHEERLTLLSREEYVSLACDFIELLPPSVVIQRLTGEAPREHLLAPLWALDKHAVLNAINTELKRRDSHQGRKFRTYISAPDIPDLSDI